MTVRLASVKIRTPETVGLTSEKTWAAGMRRGRYDNLAAQALLKTVDDASRWLRCVRPAVGVQGPEFEVRILVHKASVFGS